jgi:hypothetical protein
VDVSPQVPPTDLELPIRWIVARSDKPYLAAATACQRSWRFTFQPRFERDSSRTLTTVDDLPCRRS